MKKLQVIAGNCVLESLKTSVDTSSFLKEMSEKFNFDLIYKSSYKKDNRSSSNYFSTLGHDECAEIFSELKNIFPKKKNKYTRKRISYCNSQSSVWYHRRPYSLLNCFRR